MTQTLSPRRALRRLATLGLTAMILGGAGASVVAGVTLISRSAASVEPPAAPPTPVGVIRVVMAPGHEVARRFTGQIEPAARTELGFELGGRIAEVLADEGDRVAAGAVLARLDTAALGPERAALEAELAALAADAELARLTLARSDALTARGVRSVAAQDDARLMLARSEAQMAAVRARIAGVDVRLEKSVLTAPFAARIGARLADPGRTAAPNAPVLVLFDAAPPRLRVGLPPELAAGLSPGDAVAVEIDGARQPAIVLRIRPDLDPDTRGRSVVLGLPAAAAGRALGDTADVIVTQQVAEPGFWVPLGALREGVRGAWSVMAVEAGPNGDRVVPAAVEVIHAEGARVFLRGALPPGARIVGAAPDRVAPGQRVAATAD